VDAEDFSRGYVARVPLPQGIPYGFHGIWGSDDLVGP
ncbi:MAG: carotenoid oxygenase family protein, partial [Ilumatobacteraceae bacterium]